MEGTCKTNLPQCVPVGYPVAPIGVYGPEVPIPGGIIVDVYPGRTRPTELSRLGYISHTQLAPAGTFGPKAVAITTGWWNFASVTACSINDYGGSCSLQGGEAGGYRSRMSFGASESGATFWSLRASYTGCEGKGGLKMVHGNSCTAFPIDGGASVPTDGGTPAPLDSGPPL